MTARLITIQFSHYCEKARWALDRSRIPYQERAHVPLFSGVAAMLTGRQRTVPSLVVDGQCYPDSTDILRWVDRQGGALYPGEHETEIASLEDDFDRRLGPATRRVAYSLLLRHPDLFAELLARSGPSWQRRVSRVIHPFIGKVIARALRVDEQGAVRSRVVIDETFAAVAARLSDGRRYLTGDRFTAADLTFAALSTPVVAPPEFERFAMPRSSLPPDFVALIEHYRATVAGQFALRLYLDRA